MIIDLKRSIDLRWLFDPVLSFILRWYCSMTSSLKQLAKIRSVEAVEMRVSSSNRKRRGQIYANIFQTNLPLSANLLTEPQVLLSHNFLSRQYVLHTKYVVPKEKWLKDYWLYGYHAKVTQHCKLSARRSCWYPRRAQNQVQISSLRSFQKLRWRELCTAYQIYFWAKQYLTALHSFGVTIVNSGNGYQGQWAPEFLDFSLRDV